MTSNDCVCGRYSLLDRPLSEIMHAIASGAARKSAAKDARAFCRPHSSGFCRPSSQTVAAKRITTRVDDPIANGLDVMGINEYIGWYSHLAADADATERTSAYDKPLIMSEFGADAPFGYQGDALSRWIEE